MSQSTSQSVPQFFSNQEMLEFFLDSGVDCALEETSQDRFLETKRALEKQKEKAAKPVLKRPDMRMEGANSTRQTAQQLSNPSSNQSSMRSSQGNIQAAGQTSVPNEEILGRARQTAQNADNLETLYEAVQNFEGCNLKGTAKHTILGEGNPSADVMLICDAPGRDEDLCGKPFVGEAGILLDRMLASIDLNRENTYIGHIIPWRPPGNRPPTPFENDLCLPFIERQIELIAPKFIVLIGAASGKTLLKTNETIVRLRGKWKSIPIKEREYPCITMFHPQYLLRQPLQKKLAWRDLLALKNRLKTD